MAQPADVLIVEDEKRIRFFTGEVLRMEGISSATAADGCEALTYFEEILQQGDPLPRIVLLDMLMPCMNGTEVYEHIAAQPWIKDMVVIITSALADDFESSPNPAQTLLLSKPYEVTQLVAMVRSAAPELFHA